MILYNQVRQVERMKRKLDYQTRVGLEMAVAFLGPLILATIIVVIALI